MASTKCVVDDNIVVVAAEVDAAVSLIADVTMVPQVERLFALMDSISLSVDLEAIGAQLSM